jgi:hypothetical protein
MGVTARPAAPRPLASASVRGLFVMPAAVAADAAARDSLAVRGEKRPHVLRREVRPAGAPAPLLVQHAVPRFALPAASPLHPPAGPLLCLSQRRPRAAQFDLKEADDHVEPRRVGWERRRRIGHVFEY